MNYKDCKIKGCAIKGCPYGHNIFKCLPGRTNRSFDIAEDVPPMSLVRVNKIPEGHEYPFKEGEDVLYLGEIPNMPGHCAIVGRDGLVKYGYHTENFRLLTLDET